jgi:hypothetical protein
MHQWLPGIFRLRCTGPVPSLQTTREQTKMDDATRLDLEVVRSPRGGQPYVVSCWYTTYILASSIHADVRKQSLHMLVRRSMIGPIESPTSLLQVDLRPGRGG